MPKSKAKSKPPLKVILITVAATFIITLLLVWLANFNYLYQKHHAGITADKASMARLDGLKLDKLASKSESDSSCLKPHWPWSKSYCGSQVDTIYAGSGNLDADEKLVLDKIKFSGFIPHISFVSNGAYVESPPGRRDLAELFATTNGDSDGPDGSHHSALFVTFTKKLYDKDLASQVSGSNAEYFVVLHSQSSFASGW
jgi:hypothetical protein